MAIISEIISKSGSVFSKISEVVGEVGGWMNILGLGRSSSGRSPSTGGENKQEAGLKANTFGFGVNDEALFLDAVVLALKDEATAEEKTQKLRRVFARLTPSEQNKLVRTIGINEQDITESTPVTVTFTDPKGVERQKIEKKEKKYTANERGKRLILFLSCLSPNEAVKFLRVTILTSPIDNLQKQWKIIYPKLLKAVEELGLKEKAEKSLLWYFGATDFAEAKNNVAEREAETARLRAQSWYERDLKHRSGTVRTWVALATFIVATFVYTFVIHH